MSGEGRVMIQVEITVSVSEVMVMASVYVRDLSTSTTMGVCCLWNYVNPRISLQKSP